MRVKLHNRSTKVSKKYAERMEINGNKHFKGKSKN